MKRAGMRNVWFFFFFTRPTEILDFFFLVHAFVLNYSISHFVTLCIAQFRFISHCATDDG